MKAFTTVALDGAAASGKTTTAKIIAQKYDFMRISTGEYYRALTYMLLQAHISADDEQAVAQKLHDFVLSSNVARNKSVMLINGIEVKDELLRSVEVNANVAQFSQMPCVRKFLLDYQRSQLDIAKQHTFYGLIAEGRDIGSVIFPNADLKFFLHADLEKREQRRNREHQDDCVSCRDRIDANITTDPAGFAPGKIIPGEITPGRVIVIDTGKNDLRQVEAIISRYIEELY